MRHRTTFVLLTLFLAALGVLWWADYADVPTREKQRLLLNRLLPELIDARTDEVRRIEINRGSGPEVVVERVAGGLWQLRKPVDAAADTGVVETLAHNLIDLRKSLDSGTIHSDPAGFGLDRPEATVTVYLKGKAGPAATLDVGKKVGEKVGERLYVRPGGDPGIEVVDPRRLELVFEPVEKWRDTTLFRVPSFEVASVSVRENESAPPLTLERDDRRWRLTSPIKVPADDDKAEGLVAELSALRVADGASGFVEDDAPDLVKYGLAPPTLRIKVSPFARFGTPQTVSLGKPVPGKAGQVYALRGDQDDVVRVEFKRLREAIPGPNGLRSQKVLDFTPQLLDRLQVDALGKRFDLRKTRGGWELLSPVREPADQAAVQSLIRNLAELKASQFVDATGLGDLKLDKPTFRIRGWQPEPAPGATASKPTRTDEPIAEPRFDLSLGRRDPLKKAVYGRIAGDATVLALPDPFLKDLPRNDFAYRDRALLSVEPPQFARVTVERNGTSVTVEAPDAAAKSVNRWRMVEPVKAQVDDAAVTTLLVTLGKLRAESWESDTISDPDAFGLDHPILRVTWTLQSGPTRGGTAPGGGRTETLRVGKKLPGAASHYANIEGQPRVFTLSPAALTPLQAELHTRVVVSFSPEAAERVVLRWPGKTVALVDTSRGETQGPTWQVAPGFDPTGFDPFSTPAFLASVADLRTPKFLQYHGPIPSATGLGNPRLIVLVKIAGEPIERTLRFGNPLTKDTLMATTAEGHEGPVFILPVNDLWKPLLDAATPSGELPDNVFSGGPAPKPAN